MICKSLAQNITLVAFLVVFPLGSRCSEQSKLFSNQSLTCFVNNELHIIELPHLTHHG